MTSSTYWEKSHNYHAGAHLVDTNRKYSGTRKTDFKSSIKELKEIGDDAFFSIEVFRCLIRESSCRKCSACDTSAVEGDTNKRLI
jgi:hypothetical protein